MDVTTLILDDHHEQRRMFAILDEIGRDDASHLTPLWTQLSIFLEVHAAAEEQLFYPRLLDVAHDGDQRSARSETEDAVKDHNEIRDVIRSAARLNVGEEDWWRSVELVRAKNDDHMAEEERGPLADFRRHAPRWQRHTIAVEFAAFEAAHASGVPVRNEDPDHYIARHD